jgi:hypothetical protein
LQSCLINDFTCFSVVLLAAALQPVVDKKLANSVYVQVANLVPPYFNIWCYSLSVDIEYCHGSLMMLPYLILTRVEPRKDRERLLFVGVAYSAESGWSGYDCWGSPRLTYIAAKKSA